MPVTKCSNKKYKIGKGPCMYKSKASAERAYKGYLGHKYAEDFDRWGMPISEDTQKYYRVIPVHPSKQDAAHVSKDGVYGVGVYYFLNHNDAEEVAGQISEMGDSVWIHTYEIDCNPLVIKSPEDMDLSGPVTSETRKLGTSAISGGYNALKLIGNVEGREQLLIPFGSNAVIKEIGNPVEIKGESNDSKYDASANPLDEAAKFTGDLVDFLDDLKELKNVWGGDDEGADNNNWMFKHPKSYPKTKWLIHFTNKDPQEIIRDGFDGVGPHDIGLTVHYGGGFGDLGFAFDPIDAKKYGVKGLQSKYGKNILKFHAGEAVKVEHQTDGEWQVVFDVTTVKDLKVVKSIEEATDDPKYDASVKGAFDMLTKQKAWIPEARVASPVPKFIYRAIKDLPPHLVNPKFHGNGVFGVGTYYALNDYDAEKYLGISGTTPMHRYGIVGKFSHNIKKPLVLTAKDVDGIQNVPASGVVVPTEKGIDKLGFEHPDDIDAKHLPEMAIELGYDSLVLMSDQVDFFEPDGGEQIVLSPNSPINPKMVEFDFHLDGDHKDNEDLIEAVAQAVGLDWFENDGGYLTVQEIPASMAKKVSAVLKEHVVEQKAWIPEAKAPQKLMDLFWPLERDENFFSEWADYAEVPEEPKYFQAAFEVATSQLAGASQEGTNVKAWRAVTAPSVDDIDFKKVGVAWTYKKDAAHNWYGGSGEKFVIEGLVPLSNIDDYVTLRQNMINPDEYEIRVEDNKFVLVASVLNKNGKEIKRFDPPLKAPVGGSMFGGRVEGRELIPDRWGIPMLEEDVLPEPTDAMKENYRTRTKSHIERVKKNLALMVGYEGLTDDELRTRGEAHDADKFDPEMQIPYMWVTEYYRVKNSGEEVPEDLKKIYNQTREASGQHVKMNRHHPESHEDPNEMSVLDTVEQVADWKAMSQELNQDGGSPKVWADKNIGKWGFSPEKKELIYKTIAEMDRRV